MSNGVIARHQILLSGLSPLTFHGPGFIGDVDTLIAATALERYLTVVTLDQDFTRVPGLRVQLLERPRSNR